MKLLRHRSRLKPSSNDAHEEHEDDEIEYDEDEPPVCKGCKGTPKVMAASVPRGPPTEEAESDSDEYYFPALDDEMDHSDFIHYKNVLVVTCHNELEVRVPIVELIELSFIYCSLILSSHDTFITLIFQQNSHALWLGVCPYASQVNQFCSLSKL